MKILTVELTGENSIKALQYLENNHMIRIIKASDLNSYSLPGGPVRIEDFREWLKYSEDSPTVSLNDAKKRWAHQKKKLQNLIH